MSRQALMHCKHTGQVGVDGKGMAVNTLEVHC